jgi:hypothetical protein
MPKHINFTDMLEREIIVPLSLVSILEIKSPSLIHKKKIWNIRVKLFHEKDFYEYGINETTKEYISKTYIDYLEKQGE